MHETFDELYIVITFPSILLSKEYFVLERCGFQCYFLYKMDVFIVTF